MLSRYCDKVVLVFCLCVLVGFGCTSKPKVDTETSVDVTPVEGTGTGEIQFIHVCTMTRKDTFYTLICGMC